MKKYILCCFAVLFVYNANAQSQMMIHRQEWAVQHEKEMQKNRKERSEKTITDAEFVFEGIELKSSTYQKDNDIYSSTIFDIKKVFRGKLKTGTVEIVQKLHGPRNADPNYVYIRNTIPIMFERTFILFCRNATEFPYDPKYNIDTVTNKKILTSQGDDYISFNEYQQHPRSLDSVFETKGSVYRYLSKFPRMKIPKISDREAGEEKIPVLVEGGAYDRSDTTLESQEAYAKFEPKHGRTKAEIQKDSIQKAEVLHKEKKIKEQKRRDSLIYEQNQKYYRAIIRRDSLRRIDSLKRLKN